MKKVLVVCVAFAGSLLFSNNTHAQVKIGVFDEGSVLGLMPGISKIDTLLYQYQVDTLKPDYDYTMSDFMKKDSTFKADSAKQTPSWRTAIQKDMSQLRNKLINWKQYQDEAMQAKQNELLRPYMEKIVTTLQEIVAEQKYTYVLKSDAFSPYAQPPITDNLSIKVAQRLKLPLPKEVEDALKTAQSGGTPRPTTPAVRH
ncbi:OmpH family outer membrane protein [Chitinophagaceae bacterium LWZ2-11]